MSHLCVILSKCQFLPFLFLSMYLIFLQFVSPCMDMLFLLDQFSGRNTGLRGESLLFPFISYFFPTHGATLIGPANRVFHDTSKRHQA